MWLLKKKKKNFEYTEEEQNIIDKVKEYTGVISLSPEPILKIIKKQIDLQQKFGSKS